MIQFLLTNIRNNYLQEAGTLHIYIRNTIDTSRENRYLGHLMEFDLDATHGHIAGVQTLTSLEYMVISLDKNKNTTRTHTRMHTHTHKLKQLKTKTRITTIITSSITTTKDKHSLESTL